MESLSASQIGIVAILIVIMLAGWRLEVVYKLAQRINRRTGYLIVGIAVFAYIAFYTFFTFQRHYHFNSAAYDLGIQDQVVWNISQGNGFRSSFEVDNYFGDHVQPHLAVFALFYLIFPSAYWLLFWQTVLCASAAVPLYQLALQRLKSPLLAAMLSVIFLLHPGIGYINRFDFHPEIVAIPLLLWGVVSAEKQKWRQCVLFLLLALLAKEDTGITVAMLGLWIALSHRKRKLGLAMTAIGITYSLVALFVLIPSARGAASDTLGRYGWLGTSPYQMVLTLFLKPHFVIDKLNTVLRFQFIAAFFRPYGFLPLMHPFALTFAPALAYNFLSQAEAQHSITAHYFVPLVPLVAASTVFSLAALFKVLTARWMQSGVLWALLFFTLLSTLFVTSPVRDPSVWLRQPNADAVRTAITFIPNDAAVFTTNRYGSHLSHRARVQIPLFSIEDTYWLRDGDMALFNLRDRRSPHGEYSCQEQQRMLEIAVELSYGVIFSEQDVLLIANQAGDRRQLATIFETLC